MYQSLKQSETKTRSSLKVQKLLLTATLLFLSVLVSIIYAQSPVNKDSLSAKDFPFRANYSYNVKLGDQKHSVIAMNFWKNWDENALDKNTPLIDDSVMVLLASGQVVMGKINLTRTWTSLRDKVQSVKSTIDVWVPLHIVDKNEYWVAIWGSQNIILKDGTKSMILINEIWRINKNGKVSMIRQFYGEQPGSVKG